jgi:hypothetical protein
MQAMHGYAISFRSRGRLIGCCLVLALALGAAMSMPSLASAQTTDKYLALGDSLAFGFSLKQYHIGEEKGFESPSLFTGYAEVYAKTLNKAAKLESKSVTLQNDGCPGETSGSLIGTNPTVVGALNAALKKFQEEHGLPPVKGENQSKLEQEKLNSGFKKAEEQSLKKDAEEYAIAKITKAERESKDATAKATRKASEEAVAPLGSTVPCVYEGAYKVFKTAGKGGPLHNPYSGSQLEDALKATGFDKEIENKAPVTTITLNIGPNDELRALGGIEAEVKAKVEAKLAKIGEEAAGKYFFEHKEEVEKEGKEAAEKYFGENKPKIDEVCAEKAFEETGETEGEEFEKAFAKCEETVFKLVDEKAIGAKLAAVGGAAANKYFVENSFAIGEESEKEASEKVKAALPALIGQLNSNLAGIGTALRHAKELGLGSANYVGRIFFQEQYNPFGKQFNLAFEGVKFVEEHGGFQFGKGPYAIDMGRCAEHGENAKDEQEKIEAGCQAAALHIGFNGINELVNSLAFETTQGVFGACNTDPALKFNPQSKSKPALEPERLKKWTGMTNTEKHNGKNDGPDIHATPAGYKQLGVEFTQRTNPCKEKGGLPGF